MASNVITRVCNLQVNNAPLVDQFMASGQYNQTVASEHPDVFAASIATTGVAVPIGVVTGGQEGAVQFQNQDQANYAELGVAVAGVFYPSVRLYPGSGGNPGPPAQFDYSPGVTLRCKCAAGVPQIKMLLLQL